MAEASEEDNVIRIDDKAKARRAGPAWIRLMCESWRWPIFLAVFLWMCYLALPILPAADTWWVLAAGDYVRAQGQCFTDVDPFSYGEGVGMWLNHAWLAEFLFSLFKNWWGLQGLYCWRSAVILLSFWLIGLGVAHLWHRDLAIYSLLSLYCILCAQGAFFFDVRAYLLTYLFLSLTLAALFMYEHSRSARWLWALPLVFLCWPNMHGGYMVGLAVMMAYGVGLWLTPAQRGLVKGLAYIWLICAAVTLVGTPWGYRLWLFPFSLIGPSTYKAGLNEWAMVGWQQSAHIAALALLAVVGMKRWNWSQRLLAIFMLLASVMAWRHAPLAALTYAFLALELTPDRIGDASAASQVVIKGRRWLSSSFYALLVIAILAGALAVSSRWVGGAQRWTMETVAFPKEAADFLAANPQMSQRMYNPYEWGGYLEYRLAAQGWRFFQDGRANTVYSEQRYAEGLWVQYGEPWKKRLQSLGLGEHLQRYGQRLEVLDAYAIDLVICSRLHGDLSGVMEGNPDWSSIYEDDNAAIFVRASSPWAGAETSLVYPPRVGEVLAKARRDFVNGDFARAEEEGVRALALDSNLVNAYIIVGAANLNQEKGLWGCAFLYQALCLAPRSKTAWLNLSGYASKLGWPRLATLLRQIPESL